MNNIVENQGTPTLTITFSGEVPEKAVQRSLELTWENFQAIPSRLVIADVGEHDSRRKGKGVLLSDFLSVFLKDVVDFSSCKKLTFFATEEDYSYPVAAKLILQRAILIFENENGEWLPKEQGGYFRLTVPGTLVCGKAPSNNLDNCSNVKHIDRIEINF